MRDTQDYGPANAGETQPRARIARSIQAWWRQPLTTSGRMFILWFYAITSGVGVGMVFQHTSTIQGWSDGLGSQDVILLLLLSFVTLAISTYWRIRLSIKFTELERAQ